MAQTTKVKLGNHSERSHALLSASGASRWLNCTPSAKLEDQYGEKKTSVYAQEGTLAHELSELYISHDILKNISDSEFSSKLEAIMSNELFSDEMLEAVPIYVDYCEAQLIEAITANPLAAIEIEQKLDLTEFVPESFGTADCVIISDGIMEVIDLKYGKGVPVYAPWNVQLMLYGLGALRKYDTIYDIKTLRLTIVQPRINNISTFEISVDELLDWAIQTLKPAAEKAYKGLGDLNAGDWCKFCSVKNQCRKLYEQQMEIAKYEFSEPELLTDEEIADIIKRTPQLIEWANAIVDYAQAKAINDGKQWPGYKLVEGTSRRKWVDEEQVANILFARIPELSEDEVFDTKLKSITAIEKLVGKKRFNEQLSDTFVKPQGKPTLVPIDDKRPALDSHQQAMLDFEK